MLHVDSVALMVCAIFFALLCGMSALHKLRNWREYGEQLRDYQVLPQALAPMAALLLLAAEAVAAFTWLSDATRPFASLLGAVLLAIYGAAMAFNLARGRSSIDCGCGGQGQLIRWALVTRNAVLVIFSLAPVWMAQSVSRPLQWLDFMTAVAASFVMYGGYIAVNQLLANNPPQRSRAARDFLNFPKESL
jgi:hypothetical protein